MGRKNGEGGGGGVVSTSNVHERIFFRFVISSKILVVDDKLPKYKLN